MTFILISTILSVLALLLSVWLGRMNPARSSKLTSGMFLLILASPLLIMLPKYKVTVPWMAEVPASTAAVGSFQNASMLLPMVWGCIASLLIGRILLNRFAIHRWIKSSVAVDSKEISELHAECIQLLGLKQSTRVRYSKQIKSPIVTGLIKPTILLPESARNWSSDTTRMVLLHELGHVSRRDLWLSMAAHLTCAIHWFNPLVWILKKRLISECEFACDAHIISRGADAKKYILALCDVAQAAANQKHTALALAMAGQAPLRRRVDQLLSGNISQSPLLVGLLLTVTAGSTLAFTLVRPEAPRAIEIPRAIQVEDPYNPQEVQMRLTADPFPAN